MAKRKPTIWLINDYKLSRDSWWFRLGIPATLNFQEFFTLYQKNEKTEQEAQQLKNMTKKIIEINNIYLKHEALPPDILPHTMYADFQVMFAKFPKENLSLIPSIFAVGNKNLMITEPLLNILRNFRLGSTQISPVKLREKTTHELLSEQTYYFINVCEQHGYLSPENSDPSLRMVSRGDYSIYSPPGDKEYVKKFYFSRSAQDCPVDIWHDPLIAYSVFLSDPLYQAIHAAGLDKNLALFSCHLV